MKNNRKHLSMSDLFCYCLAIAYGLLGLFGVVVINDIIAREYQQTRDRGITEYHKALEVNLERPNTKNLNQIRGGLRQWLIGYEELQVPTSYSNVRKQVEGALAEANALNERFATMLAPDFQRELGSLQTKVAAVPPVSSELWAERNPRPSRFVLYALNVFLMLAVAGGVILISGLYRLLEKDTTGTSSTTTISKDGGGVYDATVKSPLPPEVYQGPWGQHPPSQHPW